MTETNGNKSKFAEFDTDNDDLQSVTIILGRKCYIYTS